jgi:hypothetical protein
MTLPIMPLQPNTDETSGSAYAQEMLQAQPCSTCGNPKMSGQPCPSCGSSQNIAKTDTIMGAYIYAIGQIEPRFPSIGVEKELAQVIGRAETADLTDRQVLRKVLSQPENRYLVRKICWVMTISGLETYLLMPQENNYELLVDALRSEPSPMDLDVVIGVRGPIAPPSMCNGLQIPIAFFDQIYSFDRNSFLQAIPKPEKISEEQFRSAAQEVLDRMMRVAGNTGMTDQHRALNYLSVRYPAIYERAAQSFVENASLARVEVRPSPLSQSRRIVDVIFSYVNRSTDVMERYACQVDVTEEFPFLVTPLSPYFVW